MSEEHDPLINVPAEAVVLGGMLLKNSLITEFSDRLSEDDFAEPLHRRIYSAMMRFDAKGMAATAASLRPVFALDRDADGGKYLDALIDSPAAVIAVPDLAAQVAELSVRRKAREALRDGLEQIQDLEIAVGDVVGGVEERVWAADHHDEDAQFLDLGQLVGVVKRRQQEIDEGKQTAGATNHLITELDALLGGLDKGTYTLLAGRPGMGKTSLASSAAIGWAINGFNGLYLGTEMSDEQHAMRVVSDLSHALGRGVEHDIIRGGKLDEGQRHWLDTVAQRAALLPLRYKKIGACPWRRIYSIVAREKARLAALGKELWFVVVDYLGMLQAEGPDGKLIQDPRLKMNAVSEGMMRIRDELGVAVVALAQLSRGVEQRADKRPQISDLKETGNLEQDADAILFAYREEYYLELAKPRAAEKGQKLDALIEEWEAEYMASRDKMDVIVGKNRHGQRFTKTVRFRGKFYAVRSGSHQEYEEVDELPF